MTAAGAPSEGARTFGWRAFSAPASRTARSLGPDSLRSVAQQRLVDYQRLLAGTHAAFALVAFALWFSNDPRFGHPRIGGLVNAGMAIALFASSRLLHRVRRTRATLALVDGITTVAVTTVTAATASPKLEAVGIFLTLTLLLRIAVVPSPAFRTLAVGFVCTVISVASLQLVPAASSERDLAMHVAFVVYAAVIVLVTTKASHVIHGLHEKVEEAKRLGQYVLVEKVGEGGMGSVWKARHAMLRRVTAVKLLHRDRTSDNDIARFEREVQLTSQLTHPNTVAVFDYGRSDEGTLYYAMEYVDGLSLEQLVDECGGQSAARVVHLLRQVAGALAEAHGLGLIHRDVKPANVLVCERGGVADLVKVVDFGLVKALAPEPSPLAHAASDANLIAGTPGYLAPEAILQPHNIDARADLYALGALGYYLLAARPVFEGANLVELCSHHLHTAPRPLSELVPGVPHALESLLLRCLAKDPSARPSTALHLKEELDALASALPWSEKTAMTFWQERRARAVSSLGTKTAVPTGCAHRAPLATLHANTCSSMGERPPSPSDTT